MVKAISRDEGAFLVREFNYKNLYFELSLKEKKYGYCHIQIESVTAYAHLYILRFGKEVLEEIKRDFEVIKDALRSIGIIEVAGSREAEHAERWFKFIRLIGFVKAADVEIGGRPCKLAVMEI